uniref:F-box domain-containing protein n=1 Tax=Chromera velia CCMP2878 TaxID=1169474 RepID=A0A0G4F119_9ALVE|eukprot:Cvel_14447.t1-p1 / transcript=Cvel_14447.t1 / gene=Cvel_14447 / organism=Chromera_velia_CCMP2878 / gene_product=hypothetical protein / transcript_product=hypothetical protein / location=Cvel_scaffold1028:35834-39101(-) / protein_length=340 / sequence_SO=supercontig / SO=protein_coding / is_pseudo=false
MGTSFSMVADPVFASVAVLRFLTPKDIIYLGLTSSALKGDLKESNSEWRRHFLEAASRFDCCFDLSEENEEDRTLQALQFDVSGCFVWDLLDLLHAKQQRLIESAPEDPEGKKELPTCKDLKFGDVLALGNFRDVGSAFVGLDFRLISNPDFSGEGYLTVPLSLSAVLEDPLEKFRSVQVCTFQLPFWSPILSELLPPCDPLFLLSDEDRDFFQQQQRAQPQRKKGQKETPDEAQQIDRSLPSNEQDTQHMAASCGSFCWPPGFRKGPVTVPFEYHLLIPPPEEKEEVDGQREGNEDRQGSTEKQKQIVIIEAGYKTEKFVPGDPEAFANCLAWLRSHYS